VGNKTDMENQRQVSQGEVDRMCSEYNIPHYMEVSAKLGDGVQNILKTIHSSLESKYAE
jgi:GTPase Era involved in 16S rRNA processing